MPDYDLTVLSPHEFECLCRDLLQKKENVFVESFTDGRDDGIDLRFAKAKDPKSPSETVIVQVKKYKESSRSTLFSKLRKNEALKVRKLNPDRYYFMTSLGLEPKNKADIQEIFRPYIRRSEDIFGRDDLNNLLGQFPGIEKQYYKLWLSSTNVLETILNKRYSVWTQIEKDEIERSIRLYVKNPSFDRALEILHKNRFVIISGIPGIGKTTLAQMLVNYLLANEFDEFVNIEGDLDAFAELRKEDKKQVFYFDDFLGANYLEERRLNGDVKLLNMISVIRRSPNKLLILTTREYILQDAMKFSDRMKTDNVEIAKCILNLELYTADIRAGILYKHLAEAKLPASYIDCLLRDCQYMELINHQNFNPRVIEYFIDRDRWKECTPEDFVGTFKNYFDNPFSVWKTAFENRPPKEQYALFVLLSMGQPVKLSDWESAFLYFCKATQEDLKLSADPIEWRKIIQSLQGTFIEIKHLEGADDYFVEFINHSIIDFLISCYSNCNLFRLLITGACFGEQLHTVFSDRHKAYTWEIPQNLYELVSSKICMIFKDYKSCGSVSLYKNQLIIRNDSFIQGLMLCTFDLFNVNTNFHFAEKIVTVNHIITDTCPYSIKCNLLSMLDWQYVSFSKDVVLDYLENQINCVSDYARYINLCKVLKQSDRFKKAGFEDRFSATLKNELHLSSDFCNTEKLADDLNHINRILPSLVTEGDLKLAESKFHDKKNSVENILDNSREWKDYIDSMKESSKAIHEMFNTLRQ